MRSSRLLKYFEEYIKKIDMSNSWAKAKYFHSLKSMDLAKIIATNLNIFNEEEIVIMQLIALFHDIGNFEQKNYNYLDNFEEDSTMKSIEILFDDGLIRKITDETKYDNMIKVAIFCHNKDGLPKNIDEKMICACNIMKDVHKLEELRMVINYPYIDNRINTYPSTLVYNEFKLFRPLKRELSDNNADNILIVMSNLFGLNYKISYSIVEEKQYIEKITNSLIYEDRKIEKFFKQIEIVLRNYIKKKTI
ncbi:MAG: HD domain-containing protein [Erysipelotrichaceae bacterium]|nr:HD domain-containing protein [Erysipelotrichaceae bacterium]MDD6093908.1 HD domain-containing protein [bacterium]MDY3934007.1 HD domain-containing protein [Bacilli bacterium]